MLISIISFIVVFSAVTLAHEFGHYYFSRRAGIKILELGLGFGPRLYGVIRNKTIYTLNLFPLGGFIRIAGINPEEETNDEWYFLSGSGVLANWGHGYEGAGEIGLGVMYRPEEYAGYTEGDLDRYVKLRGKSGEKRTHWIYGDWRKGFPNPIAPTARDWALNVEQLALQLRTSVSVQINGR